MPRMSSCIPVKVNQSINKNYKLNCLFMVKATGTIEFAFFITESKKIKYSIPLIHVHAMHFIVNHPMHSQDRLFLTLVTFELLGILFCIYLSISITQAFVEHKKFHNEAFKKKFLMFRSNFNPFKLYKSLIKLHVQSVCSLWIFFRHRCYGHWILLLSFQSVLIVRNPRFLFIFQ